MFHAGLQLYPLRPINTLHRRGFCALALGSLGACAAPFDTEGQLAFEPPTRAQVPGVPLIRQEDFFCGPVSIAMVMQWAGADTTQQDVAARAFSPGAGGTYLADMVGSSRRLGQLAVEIHAFDQLFTELLAGHPVIVFQNLGLAVLPVWHYGVVTGYDLEKDEVYLNSGQYDQMVMPFAVFERTWRRGDFWGLVVLPPDQLPASAPEADVLAAAAALERVGENQAAATLYQTGAARWPQSWLWPFGLANAHYAMGDLRGARRALRQARAIDPTISEIRTNLAFVERALSG